MNHNMKTDLTFLTNQKDRTLLARLKDLISETKDLDILVGYFFASGFYKIYKSLESVDETRILIGLNADKGVVAAVSEAKDQMSLEYDSIVKIKEDLSQKYVKEVELADDKPEIESGMIKFAQWLKSGKLKIKIFDKAPIHAKLYIFTFRNGIDKGRVITGSSNLTQGGLLTNLEFNVELKTSSDYEFAKKEFDELWKQGVDVTDEIALTVTKKTHLNDQITPYELYLKFLYEYFKSDLNLAGELDDDFIPKGYLDLEYQKQAVLNAQRVLEEYGGVFISDVVGLGKTYISALLANQLDGKTLVLAPPALLDENSPGSWRNVFFEYGVRRSKFRSIGNLDKVLDEGVGEYKNIFIDEAHRFRNELTQTYEKLAEICKGKRVILVSATPFNNTPKDLLSQIKLFQNSRKSTIPGLPNLEAFFSKLSGRLNKLDRKENYSEYMDVVKSNAQEIRNSVLKYLMIRRTRNEITTYFKDDLEKQGLKFPEVAEPTAIFYELDEKEESAFNHTLDFIKRFKYSRYTPFLYYEGEKPLTPQEIQAQKNMTTFMKMLLIKRFESSIYAFKKTLERFIASYRVMIDQFSEGNVYVSKKNANKVFQLLEEGREEELLTLIEEEKAEYYSSKDFSKDFLDDLNHDLKLLEDLHNEWQQIDRDIKLETFINLLQNDKILKQNKLIIFTESKETANYLSESLTEKASEEVINFTGESSSSLRDTVIKNFDAKVKKPSDKFRILVSTEVLAEGVNLHRSNVVMNYDLPWNPTRLMQRVGRINRVDTKFKKIYTYNFFPSVQSNDQIKLKEAAEAKIRMFIELLGNDARLLTEGEEIKSQELFSKLTTKEAIVGDEEEETELKYLKVIKDIRDEDVELFDRIKRLPKKARTAQKYKIKKEGLLSYFQKGKIDKFVLSNVSDSVELGFLDAIKYFETSPATKRAELSERFYSLLSKNKEFFDDLVSEERMLQSDTRSGSTDRKLYTRLSSNFIRYFKGFTEEEEEYLELVKTKLDEGALPKQTIKNLWSKIQDEDDPLKIVSTMKKLISFNLLKDTYAQVADKSDAQRMVILSELFLPK